MKQKLKEKINKKNNGITLIALVITIIVLLILAGVSIATLTGQNGILTQAQNAKKETQEAQLEEEKRLTAMEAATNLENQTYKDKNGDIATIPAGFAVSQVEGENTIDDGLVIIDKNGNEFVWIPVNEIDEFISADGYSSGHKQEYLSSIGEADSTGTNSKYTETTSTQIEARAMYASVKKYKGFYIGRYEAGKNDDGSVRSKERIICI